MSLHDLVIGVVRIYGLMTSFDPNHIRFVFLKILVSSYGLSRFDSNHQACGGTNRRNALKPDKEEYAEIKFRLLSSPCATTGHRG
ncbi:hypothetical protein LWI28_025711 [Acer negundo]|uniref:Uncharacterized protein n=1 Tax=Acer negundo TaxID=4023 RepID=A0AAD5IRS6_ACENE|nr:hypothetical protein LWI28_025711 [Acer negundo]